MEGVDCYDNGSASHCSPLDMKWEGKTIITHHIKIFLYLAETHLGFDTCSLATRALLHQMEQNLLRLDSFYSSPCLTTDSSERDKRGPEFRLAMFYSDVCISYGCALLSAAPLNAIKCIFFFRCYVCLKAHLGIRDGKRQQPLKFMCSTRVSCSVIKLY